MIIRILLLLTLSACANASNIYYIDSELGDDSNQGICSTGPLKTIGAATLSPGDSILLKSGSVYREQVNVTVDNVSYGKYGPGVNPEIRKSELFDSWVLHIDTPENGKIWKGSISGVKNSGSAANGITMERIESYRPCVHASQLPAGFIPSGTCTTYNDVTLFPFADEHFYAPLNGGVFYMRSDDGNPGAIEVGVREYAILIDGVNNIVVDSIDVFGGTGRSVNSCCSGFKHIKIVNADDVTIKNLEAHGASGIAVSSENTASNVKYENLNAYDNGGTSLYLSSTGHVINSHVHDNAKLQTDTGDRGGIGSYGGGSALFDSNHVYNNGQLSSGEPDYEISIVSSTGPVTISNNFVHDCIQGCLQIAEGGDGSVIENNIVKGFAASTGVPTSTGKYAGVRIGGGGSGSKNIKVKNNYIDNKTTVANVTNAAIHVTAQDNSGLTVTGNVFDMFDGPAVYISNGAVTTNSTMFKNYYNNSNSAIDWYWNGNEILTLQDWTAETNGFGAGSLMY